MKTIFQVITGVFVGLLAAGLFWLTTSPPRGQPITLLPTPTPAPIKVYVSGAVMSPGVYALPPDSRVQDAIEAAGGLMTDAAPEQINLAAPLSDGAQINVPHTATSGRTTGGRININTATAAELETLPGIGPTTAQKIVEYRLQYGPFRTIQDIQNVPGIGPATFAKIQDYITVGP